MGCAEVGCQAMGRMVTLGVTTEENNVQSERRKQGSKPSESVKEVYAGCLKPWHPLSLFFEAM